MVTIVNDQQIIQAKSGKTFAIYVPPRSVLDGQAAYQLQYPVGTVLDIQLYDNHTLFVTVTGQPGEAILRFHDFDIRVLL